MNTRKLRKLILTLCSALLLVSLSVGMTVAYLTDKDTVVNTFTVGQVDITLDEAPVNTEGEVIEGKRVTANTYHLLPGHEYTKDPTVHVTANSEDCYVYISVDNNGIEAIEAATGTVMGDGASKYKTVSEQILAKGWTWVTNDGNKHYFYKAVPKSETVTDLVIFNNFMVSGDVTTTQLKNYYDGVTNKNVTIVAYAVQQDGFTDFKAAWNATFVSDTGVSFN